MMIERSAASPRRCQIFLTSSCHHPTPVDEGRGGLCRVIILLLWTRAEEVFVVSSSCFCGRGFCRRIRWFEVLVPMLVVQLCSSIVGEVSCCRGKVWSTGFVVLSRNGLVDRQVLVPLRQRSARGMWIVMQICNKCRILCVDGENSSGEGPQMSDIVYSIHLRIRRFPLSTTDETAGIRLSGDSIRVCLKIVRPQP